MGANEQRKRLDEVWSAYNDGSISEEEYFEKCFAICAEYILDVTEVLANS
jgi:hypothetical protein